MALHKVEYDLGTSKALTPFRYRGSHTADIPYIDHWSLSTYLELTDYLLVSSRPPEVSLINCWLIRDCQKIPQLSVSHSVTARNVPDYLVVIPRPPEVSLINCRSNRDCQII